MVSLLKTSGRTKYLCVTLHHSYICSYLLSSLAVCESNCMAQKTDEATICFGFFAVFFLTILLHTVWYKMTELLKPSFRGHFGIKRYQSN